MDTTEQKKGSEGLIVYSSKTGNTLKRAEGFHRGRFVVAAVSVLLALLFLFGLFFGSVKIPFREIGTILAGMDRDSVAAKIVTGIRLPRIIMAVLMGMIGGYPTRGAWRSLLNSFPAGQFFR
jgi:ABC-type enterobactin transport system permease subunit